jgi:hypothetical protein
MKIIKLLALLVLSTAAMAQTEVSLPAFTKIEMDAPIKVQLVAGTISRAILNSNPTAYKFNVNNGTLIIEYSGNGANNNDIIKVYYSTIKSIKLDGVADISMDEGSSINGESLDLEIDGASRINLKTDLKKLGIKADGASRIYLQGKAEVASIEIDGASKLYGNELKCNSLKVNADGSTYFNVNASETLEINADGAAKGIYTGNPVNKRINVSGVSTIVDANTGESMADDRTQSNDDTTRITVGKKKVIIIEEGSGIRIETEQGDEKCCGNESKRYDLKKVYAGFELGMSQLMSPNFSSKLPTGYDFLDCRVEKSWFYGINLLEGDLQLVKNKLAITTGLGMEFLNLRFNTDQLLIANVNTVSADSGLTAFNKNKMYNYNLNVPLLIKFAPRTKKDINNFHFAVGVIGTFKAYSHLRTESTAPGYEQASKTKDDFNINPFRLTATARIGYGWFRAFANYSLTPYFNQENGNPDIRLFSAGITLIPFQDF